MLFHAVFPIARRRPPLGGRELKVNAYETINRNRGRPPLGGRELKGAVRFAEHIDAAHRRPPLGGRELKGV